MNDIYEFTVRERHMGGGSRPIETWPGPPVGFRTLTIWIHGYNNSEIKIRDTWRATYRRMCALGHQGGLGGVAWFFWPGDTFKHRLLSAPFYFMEVRDAVDAGQSLAAYLTGIAVKNPGLEVNIVAHSLGCRVALEAAATLSELEGPRVRNLLLFAAAVPEGLCVPGGPYGDELARNTTVLWSTADNVLRRAFRVGQAMARRFHGEIDPGNRRSAVGCTGQPSSRWNGEATSCGFEHGDYWKKDRSVIRLVQLFRHAPAFRPPRGRQNPSRRMRTRLQGGRSTGIRRPRLRA